MPGVLSKSSSPPAAAEGAPAAGVLLSLFRRCCPPQTRRRLLLALSSLFVCSSCNLLTPTLLGIAIDSASNSPAQGLPRIGGRGGEAAGFFAGIGSVLSGLCTAIGQVLTGGGKEALENQPPKVLFTLIAGVICLGALTSFIRTSQLETAEHEMRAEVRKQLFRALLYLPPSCALLRSPGHLLPLFVEDTEALVSAFSQTQAQALRYTSSVVGGGSLLLLISPRVTALAIVLLPVAGWSAMLLAKRLRRLRALRDKQVQDCTAFLSDRLFHVKTVYIHQEQEQEAYRLQERQEEAIEAAKGAAWANGCFFGGLSLSINSTVLALLTYGTALVKKGLLSYGSLTSFAVYSSMVGVGFSGLTAVCSELSRAAAAGTRIHAVLSLGADRRGEGGEETREEDPADEEASSLGVFAQASALESALQAADDKEGARGEKAGAKAPASAEDAQAVSFLRTLVAYHRGDSTAEEVAERVRGAIEFANISFSYEASAEAEDSLAGSPLASLLPATPSSVAFAGAAALTTAQDAKAEVRDPEAERREHGSRQALKNINLVIPAGSVVAITGASGSGKSTLLKLLTKQVHPQQGEITLDEPEAQSSGAAETPAAEEDSPAAASSASSDSATCSDALFTEVCRLCNAESFLLSSPKKSREDLRVEGAGTGFSTGEQQRLGLARALIKKASVLVLDEATAHLDARNERMLLQTLRRVLRARDEGGQVEQQDSAEGEGEEVAQRTAKLLRGAVKTVVLIAHSKAALQMADTVVVLRDGEIIETGAFDALIKADGELKRLLKLHGEHEEIADEAAEEPQEQSQLSSYGSWW
ncbi:ABC transporter transmembrane region domain-containing protein [Besnoitia besnoiti]|uniref:ABC transporter transmembrane region domain-containing protein n=1 Tax=Besnoitia besnoiti TaxID=94643 RepID=A0A2A9M6B3_BESBE|nr:ABC transporter transmembrane region domain-containing protein [Besnoitia besnoiti]PFH31851.1 ABC transporter transmembrane region domain-containing protein [Besnoitia besnoiti]